jgi:hypothetical protein
MKIWNLNIRVYFREDGTMRLTMVTLVLVISLAAGIISPTSGLAQPPLNNQQAADRIADSLASRFPHYDITVRYRNGQLQLQGEVGSEVMIQDVGEFVRNINGINVTSVDNRLQVGRLGIGLIPANPNGTNTTFPRTRPVPLPSRTAPVVSPETMSTLTEAARPEIATPNPALTRRFDNNNSPLANVPIPMPTRSEENIPLLIASADRNPNYSSILPPSLTSSTLTNESNNYPPFANVNNTPNPNNMPAPNNYVPNPNNYVPVPNNSFPPASRPTFRPAVSAPLPLYAPPANAAYVARARGNYDPYAPAATTPLPAPAYGNQPYYGATGPMPSAYNRPYLPPYAWPSYAAYPNYAQVSYPRSYSVQAWPYIGPFYPYPQAPLGWRQVTLKYDHARWWLDFNDGEPSGPLSPLFRQPTGYRY